MKSLRRQLICRLLIGGVILLSVAGIVLSWELRRAITAEFDNALRATAQTLATLVEQQNDKLNLEFADGSMPQFGKPNGSDVFLLSESKGKEVERSHSLGAVMLPARGGNPDAPEFFDFILPDGRALRCASMQFQPEQEEEKKPKFAPIEASLVVGRDRAPLDRTLKQITTTLILVAGGTLGALVLLVGWSVQAGLAPLIGLGEEVAKIDADSLSTRFPETPLPVELRPIVARLNALLARLESAFDRERRFTATAAHELRTPLAELRALAEVNLTTPSTELEREESWRDGLAITLRMESLSLRLLELARAEDPNRVLSLETFKIAPVVEEAWAPWKSRAADRKIGLKETVPVDLHVKTDKTLLRIILGNLCANAVEHAPSGTSMNVEAAISGETFTIRFRNPAGEITQTDIPHLFERFWRKDPARSNGQRHGLGLALAAEFAELLGGSLTAHLAGEDLEFVLQLPHR